MNKPVTMWEPIVKDNKLYGLSLNPLGKEAFLPGRMYPQSVQWQREHLAKWHLEESQRRLVEVDESEFRRETWPDGIKFLSYPSCEFIDGAFTADESNGKLINLRIL